jgi:hypothetical protein
MLAALGGLSNAKSTLRSPTSARADRQHELLENGVARRKKTASHSRVRQWCTLWLNQHSVPADLARLQVEFTGRLQAMS